jgi:hypothetical protein
LIQHKRSSAAWRRACLCAGCAGLLLAGIASASVVQSPSEPPTPSVLSAQIAGIANGVAGQWSGHEEGSGALVDPVLGPVLGTYGIAMTGQSVVVAGLAEGNESLVHDGIASLLSEVAHPDHGSFELVGLSEAYAFDQSELSGDPNWIAARSRIGRFLRRRGQSISDDGICFTSPHCYTNLKLVSAVGDLALLRTGLRSGYRHALLADPVGLRAQALAWIHQAVQNTGRDAYREGATAFTGAGILSDPSENPLAYHALSTMMLGKAILMLGARAPLDARLAFTRAARALVGLTAPDGDDTYIGRGQAQVWTAAATIDALAIAAELTGDPTWRGRYLSAAQLALARLESIYPSSGWGFPLVPRFAGIPDPTSYSGIDHYANTVEYNGLALWALDDAAVQMANAQPATGQPLPSSADGAFVDPSHARFAAVTHDGLWYAIHATDSNPGDARYGFGLVAAEIDTVDGWEQALPERPLTSSRSPGGLALVSKHKDLYPAGRHISVGASGTVKISGGWASGSKVVRDGAVWTFRPLAGANGVTLSFTATPGDGYAFEVWYEAGATLVRSLHGLSVSEPDGSTQTYSLGPRVHFATGGTAGSAYFQTLHGLVLSVAPASAPRTISFTTLLSAPAPPAGATGASGPTGSSGTTAATGPTGSTGSGNGPHRPPTSHRVAPSSRA